MSNQEEKQMSPFRLFNERPFLRNFSFLTIGNFASRFIAMITNIIVARYLAPTAYGEYSLVITYVSLLYFVASMGLSQLVIRSVARDTDNSDFYFRLSLCIRGFGWILSATVFLLFGHFSGKDFSSTVIFFVLGGVLLESIWDAQQNVAFGVQRMEINAVISIVSNLFTLVIYLVLPKDMITVRVVLSIYLGIYLLKDVIYQIWMRRKGILKFSNVDLVVTPTVCGNFFVEGFPFFLMGILGIFTGQLPIIFLEKFSGLDEVAYFNISNKLLLPISLFLQSALNAFFPNQSILYSQNKVAFSRQTTKVLSITVAIGIIMAVMCTLLADKIVLFLYGSDYASAGHILAYQCWYSVMYAIFCLNGSTLGAADAQKQLAICSIIYAVLSTPILYYASHFGGEGLSLGYIVASIINLMYIFPVLKMKVGGSLSWKIVVIIISSIIVAMYVSLAILNQSLLWILQL